MECNFLPINLWAPYERYRIYFRRMNFFNTIFDSVWNGRYMANNILAMSVSVYFPLNLLSQYLLYNKFFRNNLFEDYGDKDQNS